MRELQRELGLTFEFIKATVEEWQRIASHYPASMEHHHNQRGGLWEHSLNVALRMLSKVRQVFGIKEGEKLQDYERRLQKVRLYTALCGLFHDAGKIALYVPETMGWTYHPFLPSLPEFSSYRRSRISYRDNYLSLLVLGHCIGKDKVFLTCELFDWEELNEACLAIVKEHLPEPASNPYLALLRECDYEDVQLATEENFQTQKDIFELAFEVFCQTLKTAQPGFDFFLLPDNTLGVVSPAFTKDRFLRPFQKERGLQIDEYRLYQEWLSRGYILSEPAQVKLKEKRTPLYLLKLPASRVFTDKELELMKVYEFENNEKTIKEVEL